MAPNYRQPDHDDHDDAESRRIAELEEELFRLRASTKAALEQSWDETELLQRKMAGQDRRIERMRRRVDKGHLREGLWRSKFESARERLLSETRRESTASVHIDDDEEEEEEDVNANEGKVAGVGCGERTREMSFQDNNNTGLLQAMRNPMLVLGNSTRNLGTELLDFDDGNDSDNGPGHVNATDADTDTEEEEARTLTQLPKPVLSRAWTVSGTCTTVSKRATPPPTRQARGGSSRNLLLTRMRSLTDMLSLLEDECSSAKSLALTVPATTATATATATSSAQSLTSAPNQMQQRPRPQPQGEEEEEKMPVAFQQDEYKRPGGPPSADDVGYGSDDDDSNSDHSYRQEINRLLAELSRRDEAITELERTASDRAEALSKARSELERVKIEGANREEKLGEEVLRLRKKLENKNSALSKYEKCERHIRRLTEEFSTVAPPAREQTCFGPEAA